MVEEIVAIKYEVKGNASKDTDKLTGSTKELNKSVWGKIGAIAGFAAFSRAMFAASRASREQEKVLRQTEAVIKSTGGAAGLTAKEVNDMAQSLQKVTNYGDEVIQSGQNLLLTFTNIGKDVFPQATETMLDMSAAMGTGLKESAIQLGKALNDPIVGATALRRVGVTLTEQQMEQIKAFQKNGDILSAQKIILKELATEFGGSARAQADALTQVSNKVGDFSEKIGKATNSLLTAFVPAINKTIDVAGMLFERLVSGLSIIGFGVQTAATLITGYFFDAFKSVEKKFNTTVGFIKVGLLKVTGFWKDTADDIAKIQDETAAKNEKIDKQVATSKKWMKNDIVATYGRMKDGITAHHEEIKDSSKKVLDNEVKNAKTYENIIHEVLAKNQTAIEEATQKRIMTELKSAETIDDVYRGLGKSLFNTIKETLIAELFAEQAAAFAKIGATIAVHLSMLNFPAAAFALGEAAVAGASIAAGVAGINAITPKFAHGGLVTPTSGGTNVIMGEAGESELGLPASKVNAFFKEAGMNGQPSSARIGIENGDMFVEFVTDKQREQKRTRTY